MTHNRYTASQIIEVLKEVKLGRYPSDIADQFGIGEACIRGWCKRSGIKPARKPTIKKIDWEAIKKALQTEDKPY